MLFAVTVTLCVSLVVAGLVTVNQAAPEVVCHEVFEFTVNTSELPMACAKVMFILSKERVGLLLVTAVS